MTGGSIAASLALTGAALAPNLLSFWAAWIGVGTAMAGIFYQAAFAAITILFRTGRNRALMILTLAGGLASTIFAPITHLLLQHLTWRNTYLVLAAILALITIPTHLFALPTTAPRTDRHTPASADSVRTILRSPQFIRSSSGFALAALGMYAATLTLIPLLQTRGMTAGTAALTFGLLGAGQLLGRLAFTPLAKHTTLNTRTLTIIGTGAVLTAALAWTPGPAPLLIALSILLGAARGAETLLQATLPADIWGPDRYATLTGYFAAPITAAAALSPWIGTAITSQIGEQAAWTLFATLILTGAILVTSRPRTAPDSARIAKSANTGRRTQLQK